MQIEIPDEYLVTFCGGHWGDKSTTDLGFIIMQYLYSEPTQSNARKLALGRVLVDILEYKLKE